MSVRIQDGVSNLCLSFSGISNLYLCFFQVGASVSFGHISSFSEHLPFSVQNSADDKLIVFAPVLALRT